MEAISGRKTIREIAADHAIGLRNATHLVRPDPGEPVEATAPGRRQRALHEGEEDQGQGGGQTKEAELFQQIGRLQMELEWLKKVSAALMPVNAQAG